MRILKFIPLLTFIFLAIFFFIKIKILDSTKNLSSALIDKPFPQINLNSINDNLKLKDFIGKKNIVVNYFASWCAPCRIEHKTLANFGESHTIIGIAYKDSKKNIENFLNELGNPYTNVFLDKNGRSAIELGLYGVPETYFIDSNGIIRYKYVGPINDIEFEKRINLLNKDAN